MKPAIILASLLLAGAWGDYQTVDWFTVHPVERSNMLRWCANNIGIARATPNCENALQASDKVRAQLLLLPKPQAQASTNPEYLRWCHSLGAANPCGN